MLKILINCPGGWSHGLDSPERGEGRWAQNIARCLAMSGRYDVSACSGGIATWGRGDCVENVQILSEQDAGAAGPYDLYFDASWYDNKKVVAEVKHNFHVHFGYEPRLGVPFPPNHYLVYVLKGSRANYFRKGCGNADRTFYLPTPFGDTFSSPDPTKRGVLHTMRGSDAPGRLYRFEQVYEVVTQLRKELFGEAIPFTWIQSVGLEEPRHEQDRVLKMDVREGTPWGIPYNELRSIIAGCGLNLALDGWSNTLDALSLGVPSLVWTGGVDATLYEVAYRHGLLLEKPGLTADLYEVMRRLYTKPDLYIDYTTDSQDVFADHTNARVLELFEEMVSRVCGHGVSYEDLERLKDLR